MTDEKQSTQERYRWLATPLLAFAASRALLYLFALAGPLFGPAMGLEGPGLLKGYPTWAALAHGEIAGYARVARHGYVLAADAQYFPLLSLWGRLAGKLAGSVELVLLLTSLALCALGFVAVYRVFERLRGAESARAGVALLAAFPFAYHLSDGGGLAALLAFSAWGLLLALQRRLLACVVVFSLGVLAHPLCIFATVATFALASRDGGGTVPRRPAALGVAAVLVPALVLLAWILYLRRNLPAQTAWSAFFGAGNALRPEAWALLIVLAALLALGGLFVARWRGLWLLALAGGLQLGFGAWLSTPSTVHALAAVWPLFLGWGDLLAKRPSLRTPTIALCAAHQGLLLYCFTRFLPFT
jgi:hypothetical protein